MNVAINAGKEPLAKLGAWVANLRVSDIPPDALRAARYQVLNMIAAVHAARTQDACKQIESSAAALSGPGNATVFASGRKLPPVEAAWVNAAYAMAQDFDDIIWMGHTCHSAVFASLAVAEHEGASSEAMLVAVVVANEVGGRLGASSFFGPLNGQMWSFVHLIGAAAATAKLLKLDAEQTTHALAISLAQPTFALQPGFFQPTSKLLTASTPTATGIRAAYLAKEGVTGAVNILDDRRGFWKRFAFHPLPEMLDDLGEFWAMQTLAIKTFPGCFYFQTACTALSKILARNGALTPDQVESVEIATTKMGTEVTRFAADYASSEISSVNVNFDLSLTAAVLLHAGRLTSSEHDENWLRANSEGIEQWRRRVSVTHDPALTIAILKSASAIGAGKRALSSLKPLDVIALVRRYRSEYGSSLLSAREVAAWFKAVLNADRSPPKKDASDKSTPLHFPARVTVKFRDGRRDVVEVTLPVGTLCAPHMEMELKQKFVRESAPVLGQREAEVAFASGLGLGKVSIATFAEQSSPPADRRQRRREGVDMRNVRDQ